MQTCMLLNMAISPTHVVSFNRKSSDLCVIAAEVSSFYVFYL